MKRTAWTPLALLVVIALLLTGFGCASTPAASPTTAPAPTSAPAPGSTTAPAPAATTAPAPAPTAASKDTTPAAAPTTGAAPAGAVTLNWVSFVAKNNPEAMGLQKYFFDRVNENGKGKIQINYRGGPEAIPSMDQGAAVKNGVVDIAFTPVGFYEPLVPGIGGRVYTNQTAEQQRKSGAYDFLQGLYSKAGLYYLGIGRPVAENFFFTYFKKTKVQTQDDFKKVKIGSATAAAPAVEAWGATRVAVTMEEYFSAMERGVFDGLAGVPLPTYTQMGLHEVSKYCLEVPYYSTSVSVYMNLAKWNSLSPEVQKIIMDAFAAGEKDNMEADVANRAASRKAMVDKGMELYKLAPEVEKWYLDTAMEAAWALQMKRFPDVTPKLKELLTKQVN